VKGDVLRDVATLNSEDCSLVGPGHRRIRAHFLTRKPVNKIIKAAVVVRLSVYDFA